jgi:hypothetical protein
MNDQINICRDLFFTTFKSVLITILFALNFPAQAIEQTEVFDHFETGFPLTGKHMFLDCSRCHIGGQFKGTPLVCYLCHNGSRAPGKNIQHVPSSNICNDCHTQASWTGAVYDHSDVMEPCQNCHNGSIAIGKPPGHINSTDNCEDCHNTITFSRVFRVDHASVIGTCDSCHNGIIATGKPPGHIVTNEQCNECHNTTTWSVTTSEP